MPSGVLWSPSILLAPTGTVPSATLYVFRTFSPLRSVMVRADFTTTILSASSLSTGRARAASRTRARMQQRCDSERGLVRNVFFVDAERPEVRIGNLAKDGRPARLRRARGRHSLFLGEVVKAALLLPGTMSIGQLEKCKGAGRPEQNQ